MSKRAARVVLVIAYALLALALVAAMAGCKKKSGNQASASDTALSSLPVAQSALSTMAPDAKLLVVQTAQAVTPTSTPVWAYLFGSPKTNLVYAVYVTGKKSMGAQEYGQADLTKAQWAEIPSPSQIAIDSDAAYEKALASAGKKESASYYLGLQTYVPRPAKDETQTTKALIWYVSLDDQNTLGAPIEVDAKTGAILPKK